MERIITLSENELQAISREIQSYLNRHVIDPKDKDYAITFSFKPNSHCIALNKSGNEVILLINLIKTPKNPAQKKTLYSSFLVVIKVEKLRNELKGEAVEEYMRIYQIIHENNQGALQSEFKPDLFFEATNLVLNQAESTFLLYGPKGSLIGNLPTFNGDEQDSDILAMHLLDFNGQEGVTIKEAQFSILNPNYVLTLTSNNKFYANYLQDEQGLDHVEQEIDLNSYIQPYEKKLQYQTFCQAQSENSIGLQPFQIMFMTVDGQLYSLCPFYPYNIIMGKESFNYLIDIIGDSLESQSSILEQQACQTFTDMLIHGLQELSDPSLVNISVKEEYRGLDLIRPDIQGSLFIKNALQENGVQSKRIVVCNELPFSMLKVDDKRVSLIVSFFQPKLRFHKFKKAELKEDIPQFIQISEVEIAGSSQIYLKQDPQDELIYYLQAGVSLHKLDLICLISLSEKFIDDQTITSEDLIGIDIYTIIHSLEQKQDNGEFGILGNLLMKLCVDKAKNELNFSLESLLRKQKDEQIKQIDDKMKLDIKESVHSEIHPISWLPPKPLTKLVYDKEKCKDQKYAIQVLQTLSNYIVNDYARQYEGIDETFKEKLQQLEQLKQDYIKKAKDAQAVENELETKRSELQRQLESIKKKNLQISAAIEKIKEKFKLVYNLKNDDFVIQSFVKKLEALIMQQRNTLTDVKSRMEEVRGIEFMIRNQIKDIDNIDTDYLLDLQRFIVEQKDKLDSLRNQFKETLKE